MNSQFSIKTTALIVTYNRLGKLKNSLQKTCALPFDTIVILNNESTDGTQEWLDSLDDSRLRILHQEKNLGGAGGFKHGLHYINQFVETDWIFCFDDDAYPDSGLLDHFLRLDKKECQIFCSKVITPRGKICPMNIPYKKIPHNLKESIHYKLFPDRYLPHHDKNCDVESFSFVGSIFHTNVIRQHTHAIYENFFIYFDDLSFSFYLKNQGYRIHYDPELVFIHDIDGNTTLYSGQKLYYLIRNLILTYKLFPKKPLYTLPVIFFRILFICSLCLWHSRKKENLSKIVQGIWDGMTHKLQSL